MEEEVFRVVRDITLDLASGKELPPPDQNRVLNRCYEAIENLCFALKAQKRDSTEFAYVDVSLSNWRHLANLTQGFLNLFVEFKTSYIKLSAAKCIGQLASLSRLPSMGAKEITKTAVETQVVFRFISLSCDYMAPNSEGSKLFHSIIYKVLESLVNFTTFVPPHLAAEFLNQGLLEISLEILSCNKFDLEYKLLASKIVSNLLSSGTVRFLAPEQIPAYFSMLHQFYLSVPDLSSLCTMVLSNSRTISLPTVISPVYNWLFGLPPSLIYPSWPELCTLTIRLLDVLWCECTDGFFDVLSTIPCEQLGKVLGDTPGRTTGAKLSVVIGSIALQSRIYRQFLSNLIAAAVGGQMHPWLVWLIRGRESEIPHLRSAVAGTKLPRSRSLVGSPRGVAALYADAGVSYSRHVTSYDYPARPSLVTRLVRLVSSLEGPKECEARRQALGLLYEMLVLPAFSEDAVAGGLIPVLSKIDPNVVLSSDPAGVEFLKIYCKLGTVLGENSHLDAKLAASLASSGVPRVVCLTLYCAGRKDAMKLWAVQALEAMTRRRVELCRAVVRNWGIIMLLSTTVMGYNPEKELTKSGRPGNNRPGRRGRPRKAALAAAAAPSAPVSEKDTTTPSLPWDPATVELSTRKVFQQDLKDQVKRVAARVLTNLARTSCTSKDAWNELNGMGHLTSMLDRTFRLGRDGLHTATVLELGMVARIVLQHERSASQELADLATHSLPYLLTLVRCQQPYDRDARTQLSASRTLLAIFEALGRWLRPDHQDPSGPLPPSSSCKEGTKTLDPIDSSAPGFNQGTYRQMEGIMGGGIEEQSQKKREKKSPMELAAQVFVAAHLQNIVTTLVTGLRTAMAEAAMEAPPSSLPPRIRHENGRSMPCKYGTGVAFSLDSYCLAAMSREWSKTTGGGSGGGDTAGNNGGGVKPATGVPRNETRVADPSISRQQPSFIEINQRRNLPTNYKSKSPEFKSWFASCATVGCLLRLFGQLAILCRELSNLHRSRTHDDFTVGSQESGDVTALEPSADAGLEKDEYDANRGVSIQSQDAYSPRRIAAVAAGAAAAAPPKAPSLESRDLQGCEEIVALCPTFLSAMQDALGSVNDSVSHLVTSFMGLCKKHQNAKAAFCQKIEGGAVECLSPLLAMQLSCGIVTPETVTEDYVSAGYLNVVVTGTAIREARTCVQVLENTNLDLRDCDILSRLCSIPELNLVSQSAEEFGIDFPGDEEEREESSDGVAAGERQAGSSRGGASSSPEDPYVLFTDDVEVRLVPPESRRLIPSSVDAPPIRFGKPLVARSPSMSKTLPAAVVQGHVLSAQEAPEAPNPQSPSPVLAMASIVAASNRLLEKEVANRPRRIEPRKNQKGEGGDEETPAVAEAAAGSPGHLIASVIASRYASASAAVSGGQKRPRRHFLTGGETDGIGDSNVGKGGSKRYVCGSKGGMGQNGGNNGSIKDKVKNYNLSNGGAVTDAAEAAQCPCASLPLVVSCSVDVNLVERDLFPDVKHMRESGGGAAATGLPTANDIRRDKLLSAEMYDNLGMPMPVVKRVVYKDGVAYETSDSGEAAAVPISPRPISPKPPQDKMTKQQLQQQLRQPVVRTVYYDNRGASNRILLKNKGGIDLARVLLAKREGMEDLGRPRREFPAPVAVTTRQTTPPLMLPRPLSTRREAPTDTPELRASAVALRNLTVCTEDSGATGASSGRHVEELERMASVLLALASSGTPARRLTFEAAKTEADATVDDGGCDASLGLVTTGSRRHKPAFIPARHGGSYSFLDEDIVVVTEGPNGDDPKRVGRHERHVSVVRSAISVADARFAAFVRQDRKDLSRTPVATATCVATAATAMRKVLGWKGARRVETRDDDACTHERGGNAGGKRAVTEDSRALGSASGFSSASLADASSCFSAMSDGPSSLSQQGDDAGATRREPSTSSPQEPSRQNVTAAFARDQASVVSSPDTRNRHAGGEWNEAAEDLDLVNVDLDLSQDQGERWFSVLRTHYDVLMKSVSREGSNAGVVAAHLAGAASAAKAWESLTSQDEALRSRIQAAEAELAASMQELAEYRAALARIRDRDGAMQVIRRDAQILDLKRQVYEAESSRRCFAMGLSSLYELLQGLGDARDGEERQGQGAPGATLHSFEADEANGPESVL